MRRVLMAAAAAVAMGIASPAMAGVTLATTTGTPLTNGIYGDPAAAQDAIHVFGSAPNNDTADNIEFTGNSLLHITNGFAQIQDSSVDGDGNLNWIIINPDDLFDLFKFATQLEGTSGTVYVYYLLAGGGFDANSISSYTACGNSFCGLAGTYVSGQQDNQNYLLSGGTFDGFVVATADSTFSLFQAKQMSYNAVEAPPAVPEPATWAMMLLGFGGIGLAMRRSRRRKTTLMQVA